MLRNLKNFSPPEIEERVLKFWTENRIFEKSLEKTKKGKPFTFYDGPPFATGLPHYGHILASTIKDVIPRYQTMKGRFVRRRWGWDCHGLPIEEIVERHLGISGKKEIEKIGIGKFNAICRSKVLEFVNEWGKMVRRIARWVDFDNSYKTMDTSYMESVWWAFKEIYDKKLVYEGRKVLMYCPRCETPVSNFEVAMDNSYKDVTEDAVTVKFKVKPKTKEWENTSVLSWTTTPWTLPGNVALAVNPKHKFMCVPDPNEKNHWLVLGEESYKRLVKNGVLKPAPKEETDIFNGKDMLGIEYEPLFKIKALEDKKSYHIYAADFVTTTEGTGIVHTAVVYGEEDYELGQKVGLPVVPFLDEKGIFNNKAPEFLRGKYFKKADELIIKDLEKRGLLFKKEKYTHSYPHCWRCETPLFYNAIPAWFINIQKIKKKIIDSNRKEINWFPEHLKRGRYENSVKDAPDWNISRNRYWGNPIPIWRCEKCGKTETVGSVEELEKQLPKSTNRYILVRHAESQKNLEKISSSWPEKKKYHLTTIGKDQSYQLGKDLKKQKIDLIFASDLTRTKETAEMIAKEIGLKVVYDPRLRELNVGDFNGKREEEYDRYFNYPRERLTRSAPNGESINDLRKRVFDFLKFVEKKHKNKKIIIVSHGDPLWMMHGVMAGLVNEDVMGTEGLPEDFYPKEGKAYTAYFRNIPRNEIGELDLHRPYIDEIIFDCKKCGGKMERIKEIFDSWFEAGSMPFAEYHYPFENKDVFKKRFPAQFVAEYIAQTRAWFYVMHVVSLTLFNRAPFENVVTTGTILAEDSSKMSKSKGNFPDPWDVINKYGVDALRFYLMSSAVMQAADLNFSAKEVEKIYRKNILILWNVYRYFEIYSHTKKNSKSTNVLDVWIKARTKELVNNVTKYLDVYDTVRATRAIEEHISDLSTWYVRRSRGRADSSFFSTLQESLIKTSQVIAPFMPYLAEVLHLNLVGTSVHLADWPKAEKLTKEEESILKEMEWARYSANLALAERAEVGIKVRQPVPKLTGSTVVLLNKFNIKAVNVHEGTIKVLLEEINAKEFEFKDLPENRLDLTITHELEEEGWLREFVRLVQGLRKDAGLEPKDRIVLLVELPDELRHVVGKNESFVKDKLGAKNIEYRRSEKFEAELETKIGEWPVWVGLRKPR